MGEKMRGVTDPSVPCQRGLPEFSSLRLFSPIQLGGETLDLELSRLEEGSHRDGLKHGDGGHPLHEVGAFGQGVGEFLLEFGGGHRGFFLGRGVESRSFQALACAAASAASAVRKAAMPLAVAAASRAAASTASTEALWLAADSVAA